MCSIIQLLCCDFVSSKIYTIAFTPLIVLILLCAYTYKCKLYGHGPGTKRCTCNTFACHHKLLFYINTTKMNLKYTIIHFMFMTHSEATI